MRYYFAPMEGITDSIYRQLHHKYFPGLDRYYTPFFSPTMHRKLTAKEQRELPMTDTLDYTLIPQVLTKSPEDFLWFAGVCQDRGYREINLNLGCPSGTVTAKGKGAGMLQEPDTLKRFLDITISRSPLPVSVKTRLGFSQPEEFFPLLDIFNQFPICELTVHPRVRRQFYKENVDMAAFGYAVENSKNPLCYNGDLCSLAAAHSIASAYPKVEAVMVGRALIADPGMLTGGTDRAALEGFCSELLDAYTAAFGSARNAMFRLKENWHYLLCKFDGSEKLGKRLRKTTDIGEFKAITAEIFSALPILETPRANW